MGASVVTRLQGRGAVREIHVFWSEDVVAYPRRGKGSDVGLCKALFAFVLWFLGKVFPACTPRVEDDLGPSLPRCWGVFSCVAVSVFVLEKAFVLASSSVFLCQPARRYSYKYSYTYSYK